MYYKKNLNEFVAAVVNAEIDAFNTNPKAKALLIELFKEEYKKNPNITLEEWKKAKEKYMTALFFELVADNNELSHEFCHHLYNEMRK